MADRAGLTDVEFLARWRELEPHLDREERVSADDLRRFIDIIDRHRSVLLWCRQHVNLKPQSRYYEQIDGVLNG